MILDRGEILDIRKNARGWAIVAVSFLILMFIFATCISCMGVYVKPVSEDFGNPQNFLYTYHYHTSFCHDAFLYAGRKDAGNV